MLRLSAKRRSADTVIADLRQEGSLKALFPKVRGTALDTVFLNTAGGLTGGDRMELDVSAQEAAHVVVSSQAAERGYRAQSGEIAEVAVTLRAAAGSRIDWMPQETILFDQAAVSRRMNVHLQEAASVLLVEPIILGRRAMGETVRDVHFRDQWRVWRDDALIFADAIRLSGDADALMARAATGQGASAMSTILLAGADAAQRASALSLTGLSGASLIDDNLLLVRLLAEDGYALRQQMLAVLARLSDVPIPRVWRL
ncbi:urease accessory protein UreD [Yoonia litorea]|uniref:Urease accessory protein UreD n=1 Tax=Yoonia litorea TaxID=1123755 RepID=A0A1I6N1C3_9RHOB|nr:urease accessory protein UreD [Yoonia litorea]SFS21746.1 urease accessory protein [Yoonia litorea]